MFLTITILSNAGLFANIVRWLAFTLFCWLIRREEWHVITLVYQTQYCWQQSQYQTANTGHRLVDCSVYIWTIVASGFEAATQGLFYFILCMWIVTVYSQPRLKIALLLRCVISLIDIRSLSKVVFHCWQISTTFNNHAIAINHNHYLNIPSYICFCWHI